MQKTAFILLLGWLNISACMQPSKDVESPDITMQLSIIDPESCKVMFYDIKSLESIKNLGIYQLTYNGSYIIDNKSLLISFTKSKNRLFKKDLDTICNDAETVLTQYRRMLHNKI